MDNYKAASEELANAIGNAIIEYRIFRNWLVVISAFRTLKDLVELPWAYSKLLGKAANLIIRQNKETKKSNELSVFWQIVEYLTNKVT